VKTLNMPVEITDKEDKHHSLPLSRPGSSFQKGQQTGHDGDGDWQNYLKVRVAGFRFKFSSIKRAFIGSISLEEVTV